MGRIRQEEEGLPHTAYIYRRGHVERVTQTSSINDGTCLCTWGHMDTLVPGLSPEHWTPVPRMSCFPPFFFPVHLSACVLRTYEAHPPHTAPPFFASEALAVSSGDLPLFSQPNERRRRRKSSRLCLPRERGDIISSISTLEVGPSF